MNEEIIITLSNLGAIEETKAVAKEILSSSERLKDGLLDIDIKALVESGYVKITDGKVYLTKAGLLRALSKFS